MSAPSGDAWQSEFKELLADSGLDAARVDSDVIQFLDELAKEFIEDVTEQSAKLATQRMELSKAAPATAGVVLEVNDMKTYIGQAWPAMQDIADAAGMEPPKGAAAPQPEQKIAQARVTRRSSRRGGGK
jgi:hypothetical protein